MKKAVTTIFIAATLTGCASFEPTFKDGKEYAGSYPVLYHGVVEDIQYTDEKGTVRSVAQNVSDTAMSGTGAIASVANMTTGISSLGGGLIATGIGLVASAVAANSSAPMPIIVVRKADGEVAEVPTPIHLLKQRIEFNCIEIGEPVRVVNDPTPYLYVMHKEPVLQRRTAFDPSCTSLRGKHNIPLKQTAMK